MNKYLKGFLLVIFIIFLSTTIVTGAFVWGFYIYEEINKENSTNLTKTNTSISFNIKKNKSNGLRELPSPSNWVSTKNIYNTNDGIKIRHRFSKHDVWCGGASKGNTNSEEPIIDVGTTTCKFKIKSREDVGIGDIVIYEREDDEGLFIHRVIDIRNDTYIIKCDHPDCTVEEELPFENLKYTVFAIIY